MSADSDMEYSDNDGDDYDYYGGQDDCDMETIDRTKSDPEYFLFTCLKVEEVEKLLNESIELLSNSLQITPSLAKVALHAYQWNAQEIINKYKENANEVLVYSHVKPPMPAVQVGSSRSCCAVCAGTPPLQNYSALACGHYFCNDCWAMHFEVQIMQGVSNTIQCMAQQCEVRAPEDFVISHVPKPALRERYQQFMFKDHWLFRAWTREGARRVECQGCELLTCFSCGAAHHAPTDCATIRRWLTKCADDSETANYIRDWKCHGSEYYECSRYKEDPNLTNDNQHAQAREALKKYLHYYERWENHARSLKAETTDRGDLENQMDIAEKRRTTLLKDFLEFNTNSAPSSSK
ncbi:Ariadne 2, partial [Operophtera brumata]